MKKMKKKATLYMDSQTQLEIMKQIFIQETHDNKRPIIREDFAEWLELETAVFWIASTYTVWSHKNNPSLEECFEMAGENLVVLHFVFGTDLKVLIDMLYTVLRKFVKEELRQVEEEQKGMVLN